MEIKKTVKKIAALGVGATMLGATLVGAMAAADLADYPTMFFKEGKFNGILVVGENAKATDIIGTTNIMASLQAVSIKKTIVDEGAAETTTKKVVTDGALLCKDNFYLNRTLSLCETSIDDADLPDMLAREKYNDDKGNTDNTEEYDQTIYFSSTTANVGYTTVGAGTGRLMFTQDDDDAPNAGVYMFIDDVSTDALYRYDLAFTTSVDYDNTSAATVKADIVGSELKIQGITFTVTNALSGTVDGMPLAYLELELLAGETKTWIGQGESVKRTIDGVEHTVEMTDVNDGATRCKLVIDGTSVVIDTDNTKTVNGLTVGVTDAIAAHEEAQDSDSCEVSVGAVKVTMKHNSKVKINDVDLDGSKTNMTHTQSNKWDGFRVLYAPANDEVYLGVGDEWPDPVFGAWKFVFANIEKGDTEDIKMDSSTKDGELTFHNEDGRLVTIPYAAESELDASNGPTEPVWWGEKSPKALTGGADGDYKVNKRLYFEGETCDASGITSPSAGTISNCQGAEFLVVNAQEAHVMKIANIDTTDDKIDFEDLTYARDGDKDKTYTNGGLSSFSLGGGAGTIQLRVNESGKFVTFTDIVTGTGSAVCGGYNTTPFEVPLNFTAYYKINCSIGEADETEWNLYDMAFKVKTKEEGNIVFYNVYTNNQTVDTIAFRERSDSRVDNYLSTDTEFNFTAVYDDSSDNRIELLKYGLPTGNGFGFVDASKDNDEETQFMTLKGTLIKYDDEKKKYLYIEHPTDAAYAEVYVAPTSVATTEEEVGNFVTEIVPISVEATKFDSEVLDAKAVNVIAIGGPCANSVVSKLMGDPAVCETSLGIKEGQAVLKLIENGENVALIVAGYTGDDTRLASKMLSDYKNQKFKGNDLVLTTTSENDFAWQAASEVVAETPAEEAPVEEAPAEEAPATE